ncbi:hypothetical protein [Pantoea dispersa]|uniref:hypothetical protein n=1 Tax=Pantoea dispersa TaxID=59814 RepID=UPI00163A23F3|nr:hypothetical protein [Pantoea dispersa]
MNTPDTAERRGGIKGRSAPGERTGDSRLQGLRQDGNPLARNGPGQRRRAGSVRSMTADRTPGEKAFVLSISGEKGNSGHLFTSASLKKWWLTAL